MESEAVTEPVVRADEEAPAEEEEAVDNGDEAELIGMSYDTALADDDKDTEE